MDIVLVFDTIYSPDNKTAPFLGQSQIERWTYQFSVRRDLYFLLK